MSLRVLVLDTAADVARHVAGRFLHLLRRPCVLGLATGSTTLPIYARLVEAHRAGRASFRHMTTFNLDEYVGLVPGHPASFVRFMREALFDHVDIDPARVHLLDSAVPDPAAEAERYERAIRTAGGIDLQLLGIGANGHIGFNEPGSALSSRTRCVTLAPSTRDANRHFFDSEPVPRQALTMGIATILDAREIMLAATGPSKARAVACAVDGPITPECPASALQAHAAATIVCDREAVAGLDHPRSNGAPCATS